MATHPRTKAMYFFSVFRSSSPSLGSSVVCKAFMCTFITCLARVWEEAKVKDKHEWHIMRRDFFDEKTYCISRFIMLIFNDEDHVKSGENGRHEVDIILAFCVIPSTKDAVGSSQDRASGVQGGCDSSLYKRTEQDIKVRGIWRWSLPVHTAELTPLSRTRYNSQQDTIKRWKR